jgi:hypothetical protein
MVINNYSVETFTTFLAPSYGMYLENIIMAHKRHYMLIARPWNGQIG